jgi:cholesterol transport system auxiliary component
MNQIFRRLAALLLVLTFAGCGASAPLQRDRFYALEPVLSMPASASTPVPAILLVNPLAARGFLGGRQIIYRESRQSPRVERYDALLWEEPVPRAMARVLTTVMRDAGIFRSVVIPVERARADYVLNGEVEHFEHWPRDQPPCVIATLNLSLVRVSDRQSVWTRRISGEEPVPSAAAGTSATPDAMAAAFNRLAARLASAVARDLLALHLNEAN